MWWYWNFELRNITTSSTPKQVTLLVSLSQLFQQKSAPCIRHAQKGNVEVVTILHLPKPSSCAPVTQDGKNMALPPLVYCCFHRRSTDHYDLTYICTVSYLQQKSAPCMTDMRRKEICKSSPYYIFPRLPLVRPSLRLVYGVTSPKNYILLLP